MPAALGSNEMNPTKSPAERKDGNGDIAKTRIQSVSRASRILLWVASRPLGGTAKEIAAAQGFALPTTYHLLNTLVDEGLLTKEAHRRYILGQGGAVLAQAYLRNKSAPESMLRALRDLARQTGETAYLADWGESGIRVLASVEGSHMLRVAEVERGAYEHGHARANGKVLLAFTDPEMRESYLRRNPLVPLTKGTITDPESLDKELEEIRKRGYAYDFEEYEPGVICVAAPVLSHGSLIAAVGLSVPAERMRQKQAELTAAVLDTVARLESDGDGSPSSDDQP